MNSDKYGKQRVIPPSAKCLVSSDGSNNNDQLITALGKLKINQQNDTKANKSGRHIDGISPADFVTLQSLRSSALARKTNTTSKSNSGGTSVFFDLLNLNDDRKQNFKVNDSNKNEDVSNREIESKESKKSMEEKNNSKKNRTEFPAGKNDVVTKETASDDKRDDQKRTEDDKEQRGSRFLPRGPVRSPRAQPAVHPYNLKVNNCITPQLAIDDYSLHGTYRCGYESGSSGTDGDFWGCTSNRSTPDTSQSERSNDSCSPFPHSASNNGRLESDELNHLPDALSDFILEYSQRYAVSPKKRADIANTTLALHRNREILVGHIPTTPLATQNAPLDLPSTSQTITSVAKKHENIARVRTAKERLRSMIDDFEMSVAWAWTCKCIQYFPGALCYQDKDQDTLLHIVVVHMDLAKIYALVEQMLKIDYPPSRKPFDMPNRFSETPLFLAVEKGHTEVVAYLLEIGANPNTQSNRPERDTPLHYAAARGMTKVVETLCANPTTEVNVANGLGLTPLLCAVRNHGVIEEVSQCVINNKPTILTLISHRADPVIVDAVNGRTLLHYAIERMEPELIEFLKSCLDHNTLLLLSEKRDLSGETALRFLTNRMSVYDAHLRHTLYASLASICRTNNEIDQTILATSGALNY